MAKLEKNVKVIEEEAVVEVTETKKKKKKKLILTIGGIVLLLVGGIAGVSKLLGGKKTNTEVESDETYTDEIEENDETEE